MKTLVAIIFVAVFAYGLGDDEKIDLDDILGNDALLKAYSDCLLDKGPCTPDGEKLKGKVPEALENGCETCSEEQKQGVEKTLKFLINNKPELWEELDSKYDPEGKYKEKYVDKLAGLKD